MSAIRGVNGGEDDFISLTLCSAVTQEQSGALSLVEIVDCQRGHHNSYHRNMFGLYLSFGQ